MSEMLPEQEVRRRRTPGADPRETELATTGRVTPDLGAGSDEELAAVQKASQADYYRGFGYRPEIHHFPDEQPRRLDNGLGNYSVPFEADEWFANNPGHFADLGANDVEQPRAPREMIRAGGSSKPPHRMAAQSSAPSLLNSEHVAESGSAGMSFADLVRASSPVIDDVEPGDPDELAGLKEIARRAGRHGATSGGRIEPSAMSDKSMLRRLKALKHNPNSLRAGKPGRDAEAISDARGAALADPEFRDRSNLDEQEMLMASGIGVHVPPPAKTTSTQYLRERQSQATSGRAALEKARKKLSKKTGDRVRPVEVKANEKKPWWKPREATTPKSAAPITGGIDLDPKAFKKKSRAAGKRLKARAAAKSSLPIPTSGFARTARGLASIGEASALEELDSPLIAEHAEQPVGQADIDANDYDDDLDSLAGHDEEDYVGEAALEQRAAEQRQSTQRDAEQAAADESDYDDDLDSLSGEDGEAAEEELRESQAISMTLPERPGSGASNLPGRREAPTGASPSLDRIAESADRAQRAREREAAQPIELGARKSAFNEAPVGASPSLDALADRAAAAESARKAEHRKLFVPDLGEEVDEELEQDAALRRKNREKRPVAEVNSRYADLEASGERITRRAFRNVLYKTVSRTDEDAQRYEGPITSNTLTGLDELSNFVENRQMFAPNREENGVTYKDPSRPHFQEFLPDRFRHRKDENSPVKDLMNPQARLEWDQGQVGRDESEAAHRQNIGALNDRIIKESRKSKWFGPGNFWKQLVSFGGYGRKGRREAASLRGQRDEALNGIALQRQEWANTENSFGNRAASRLPEDGPAGPTAKGEIQDAAHSAEGFPLKVAQDTQAFAGKRAYLDQFYDAAEDRKNRYLNSTPRLVSDPALRGREEHAPDAPREPKWGEGDFAKISQPDIGDRRGDYAVRQKLEYNTAVANQEKRFERAKAEFPGKQEQHAKAVADFHERQARNKKYEERPGLADLYASQEQAGQRIGYGSADIQLPREGAEANYSTALEQEALRRAGREIEPKYAAPAPLVGKSATTDDPKVQWGDLESQRLATAEHSNLINHQSELLQQSEGARGEGGARFPAAAASLAARGKPARDAFEATLGRQDAWRTAQVELGAMNDDIALVREVAQDRANDKRSAAAEQSRTALDAEKAAFKESMRLPEPKARPKRKVARSEAEPEQDPWANVPEAYQKYMKHLNYQPDEFERVHQEVIERDRRQALERFRTQDGSHSNDPALFTDGILHADRPLDYRLDENYATRMSNVSPAETKQGKSEEERIAEERGERVSRIQGDQRATLLPGASLDIDFTQDFFGSGKAAARDAEVARTGRLYDGGLTELKGDVLDGVNMTLQEFEQKKGDLEIFEARKQGQTLGLGSMTEQERADMEWKAAEGQITTEAGRREKLGLLNKRAMQKDDRHKVTKQLVKQFASAHKYDLKNNTGQYEQLKTLMQDYNNHRMAGEKQGLVKRPNAEKSKAPALLPGRDRERLTGFLADKQVLKSAEDATPDLLDAYSMSQSEYVNTRIARSREAENQAMLNPPRREPEDDVVMPERQVPQPQVAPKLTADSLNPHQRQLYEALAERMDEYKNAGNEHSRAYGVGRMKPIKGWQASALERISQMGHLQGEDGELDQQQFGIQLQQLASSNTEWKDSKVDKIAGGIEAGAQSIADGFKSKFTAAVTYGNRRKRPVSQIAESEDVAREESVVEGSQPVDTANQQALAPQVFPPDVPAPQGLAPLVFAPDAHAPSGDNPLNAPAQAVGEAKKKKSLFGNFFSNKKKNPREIIINADARDARVVGDANPSLESARPLAIPSNAEYIASLQRMAKRRNQNGIGSQVERAVDGLAGAGQAVINRMDDMLLPEADRKKAQKAREEHDRQVAKNAAKQATLQKKTDAQMQKAILESAARREAMLAKYKK